MTSLNMSTALVVLFIVLSALLLYRLALPKPIPGIPYDQRSASRILGDVPDALKHLSETQEMVSFLVGRCEKLNSPVIQVFLRPFQRPRVVVMDGREAHDIMTKRTREFDRGFVKDLLIATHPHAHVIMDTNDQWRSNRKLVADVMSTDFLNNTTGPSLMHATQSLLDLWREKMRLANGQPFDASHDTNMCTMDTIFAALFGSDIQACASQRDFLAKIDYLKPSKDFDHLAQIPTIPTPKLFDVVEEIAGSSQIAMNSPIGSTHHWLATKLVPKLRRAIAYRDRWIADAVRAAWQKFASNNGNDHDDLIKSAVDLIVEREVSLAKKQGRPPQHDSVYVKCELASFLVAGYETTATALNWGLKYMTAYPEIQTKLRAAVRDAFMASIGPTGHPSHDAMTKIQVPYLEACINEILRHSEGMPANSRKAIVDTQILGYHIPKGTEVMMPASGPSYVSPPMFIDESKRSSTSREAKLEQQRWSSHSDLEIFRPERWLVDNGDGVLEFDSRAAPLHSFGAGLRSCFGKKLAYLELRVIYTLVLWNFELLPVPEPLADMKGKDTLTRQPQTVYIRLREAKAM
ncbi:hypothetical protein MBLNU457_5024t1 [Dothideomycetes sp. NU457]